MLGFIALAVMVLYMIMVLRIGREGSDPLRWYHWLGIVAGACGIVLLQVTRSEGIGA